MAGVVNLVLNNRATGFQLDMDYGINEAGDGASPHISASGGTPLFQGRGHVLVGVEWQKTEAIPDCAAARDWCRDSRTMFTNSTSSLIEDNFTSPVIALPGFEGYPARFQMANVRFSQFSPNGVIYDNNTSLDLAAPPPTSGYRFTPDGRGIEEFAYGFRGASNQSSVMNGRRARHHQRFVAQGPAVDRKTLFSNFEFNFTERLTGYLQTNYAKTEGFQQESLHHRHGLRAFRYEGRGLGCRRIGESGRSHIFRHRHHRGRPVRAAPYRRTTSRPLPAWSATASGASPISACS